MILESNVERSDEVSVSPQTPDKLAHQQCQPAQKPRIDEGKTSKAAAEKTLSVKFRFP